MEITEVIENCICILHLQMAHMPHDLGDPELGCKGQESKKQIFDAALYLRPANANTAMDQTHYWKWNEEN